jgi:hypothetical protein
MKRLLLVAAVVAFAWLASRYNTDPAASSDVQDCVSRGVGYFKEIEAYPQLSDGRSAEAVARERCGRSTTAFP